MKTRLLILILIPVIVFSTLLSYFIYNQLTIENIIVVGMDVRVDDHFGLNADTDALHFGRLTPISEGERKMILENNASYPVRVHFVKEGLIGGWVDIEGDGMILESKESNQINFSISVPDAPFGVYNGSVTVIFRKNLFD